MVDDQTLIRPSSGRASRGPTRFKRLSFRRAAGEKTHVDIDDNTGMASSPNAKTFSNYLGVVSLERLSIFINSWNDVLEVDRNMLWEDVLGRFTLLLLSLMLEQLRSKIISNNGIKFRQFKSTLMTKYVFGKYKGQNPCLKYANIHEET